MLHLKICAKFAEIWIYFFDRLPMGPLGKKNGNYSINDHRKSNL